MTPIEVYSSLGEQSGTWASILDYSLRMQARMSDRKRSLMKPDNLLGVESIIQIEEDFVVDALKNIPGDHVNQVEVAVFDLKGVVAVELFNHSESITAAKYQK